MNRKPYLSVDEFMTQGFDSDGSDGSNLPKKSGKQKRVIKTNKVSEKKRKKLKKVSVSENGESEDKILNFEDSDDDSVTEDPAKNETFHKPPEKLEVDSGESDFSANEDDDHEAQSTSEKIRVSSALIVEWREQLEEKPTITLLRTVMLAFRAAVEQASDEGSSSQTQFVVKGSTAFNSVVKLCLTSLVPALHKVLHLPPPSVTDRESKFNPKKSKFWVKINTALRSYLADMVKMLTVVAEADIVIVLLRHILYLAPFYILYPKHSRLILKKLVSFWSTSEESVRVLAFLSIIRILRMLPTSYLDYFLKQLYLSYVSNCKFTSPTTWPLINFMKRSLVELYSLDPSLAYQHAFVYIRQLAIHLRNALTTKKKDSYQAVYNWQYVHCLLLWSHLLTTVQPSPVLAPLVYPLTQVALGVIGLIPTAKYLPLRFHLIRALTILSEKTGTFIPILPLIIQVFNVVDMNKRHTSMSLKPMDFSCILKLSKSQLSENAFRDGCIQQVYELLIDYLHIVSHSISYPELVFPATVQIRSFLKSCKVGNYTRQIKQGLDKMEENSKFIQERRQRVTFGMTDFKAVADWETHCKEDGTPINKYYVTWRKLKDQEIMRSIVKKDQVEETNLPEIDRKKFLLKKVEDQNEFSELFASASEDEDNSKCFQFAIDKTERSNQEKASAGKKASGEPKNRLKKTGKSKQFKVSGHAKPGKRIKK